MFCCFTGFPKATKTKLRLEVEQKAYHNFSYGYEFVSQKVLRIPQYHHVKSKAVKSVFRMLLSQVFDRNALQKHFQ